jgi:hypothetical protein
MSGGSISNNTAGGVLMYGGNFNMSNGIISGNKSSFGAGVYINSSEAHSAGSYFLKSGGIIYGKDEGTNSNIAYGDTGGHAVYIKELIPLPVKYRDTTLRQGDNLTTDDNVGWNQ